MNATVSKNKSNLLRSAKVAPVPVRNADASIKAPIGVVDSIRAPIDIADDRIKVPIGAVDSIRAPIGTADETSSCNGAEKKLPNWEETLRKHLPSPTPKRTTTQPFRFRTDERAAKHHSHETNSKNTAKGKIFEVSHSETHKKLPADPSKINVEIQKLSNYIVIKKILIGWEF